jgi:hypothetical protein
MVQGSDAPAKPLEAPVTGTEDASLEEVQTLRSGAEIGGAADLVRSQIATDAAFKQINAQPKVRIRVPKVNGPQTVIINGARFDVPANVWVMVPEQVAEVLTDAERI